MDLRDDYLIPSFPSHLLAPSDISFGRRRLLLLSPEEDYTPSPAHLANLTAQINELDLNDLLQFRKTIDPSDFRCIIINNRIRMLCPKESEPKEKRSDNPKRPLKQLD